MKPEMTSKERFLAAIKKEPVDYVPTCGPFPGYWALGYSQVTASDSIKKPELGANAQLKVIQNCDFDGIEAMWDWLAPAEAIGCKIQMPDLGSPITMEHVITDKDSLKKLEVPDVHQDYRIKSAVASAQRLIDHFGNEKYFYCTIVAPFTLAAEIRGVENILRDIYKNPSLVKDILEFTTEVLKNYYGYLAKLDVDGIFICDPTASGSLISKKVFEAYAKPYIIEVARVVRKANKHVLFHICGDTSDRIESFMEIDHDVLSVDSLVDFSYAKEVLGEKITTLGNIDVANTLYMGTQEQVENEIRSCLEKTGNIGHILGGACDIAPETPMDNVSLWKQLIKKMR
jgi:MtaA/CmuA family methyltransferase